MEIKIAMGTYILQIAQEGDRLTNLKWKWLA